eukprot:5635458-Prymnesium_polylepis.1
MAGREDHAAMWDDPVLDEHLDLGQYEHIYFMTPCWTNTLILGSTSTFTSTNAVPEIIRACRRRPSCRPLGGSLLPCARDSCRS